MDQASALGAELICFGETFLQGFNCFTWNFAEASRIACSVRSAPFVRIDRMSREKGIDVLFRFAERDGERLFSSCALVEKGALTQTYRRISRGWKEYRRTDVHYCEGGAPSIFAYSGKALHHDAGGELWDFPERFAFGPELLFRPVYISYPPQQWGGCVFLCNSLCPVRGRRCGLCKEAHCRASAGGQEDLLLYEV